MQAMVLRAAGSPLEPSEIPVPAVTAGQVLLRVESCAVCRTDLHVIDGELRNPKLPLIPGHQIVGTDDGTLVVTALRNLVKGGTVLCGGIHMSEIPSFPYEWLWDERSGKINRAAPAVSSN